MLHNVKNKFKFQKKYFAFFAFVPLLAATALIKVPCPVCGGTGYISSTGMDQVVVSNVQVEELTRFSAGCDSYRVYNYKITATLENQGTTEAAGYVSFYLVDKNTGQILDQQYGVADVPAESQIVSEFNTYFQISKTVDMPNQTQVNVKVLEGKVPCRASNGTGKVSLNEWPVLNAYKATFHETQRVSKPYLPPLWVETEGQAGIDW